MASLLQITKACKSYGDQVLLDGAEATISDNVKVGFIGRNGAGKSTLLRILLGEEELDSGEVIRHPSLRLGYLRQHDPFLPGETALEFLMRDSGEPDWKCGEVAGQFELKGAYLEGPIAKLSGGWQTRVKLAALLLHEPNLLLLDEPTNFLDLRTQILLEHFLRNYRAACLIVSHDRAFLGATCNHTLGLSRGKLTTFPGKVDAYLEFQREKRMHDERSNATILAKRRHLEDFIARNKARAATATLAQSKTKQLERLELTEIARRRADGPHPRAARRAAQGPALRCRDLAIGYPERQIAADVQLEIDHGSRRGRRRRQRPGQDDVPAHGRGLAQAARRRGPLGLRLPDRRLRPARLHQPAGEPDRPRLPAPAGRPRQEGPGNPRRGRRVPVPRRARQEADLRPVRRRACPALPRGPAC